MPIGVEQILAEVATQGADICASCQSQCRTSCDNGCAWFIFDIHG